MSTFFLKVAPVRTDRRLIYFAIEEGSDRAENSRLFQNSGRLHTPLFWSVALALMTGSAWFAWKWQANAYGKELATQKATHQTMLTQLANANSAQLMPRILRENRVKLSPHSWSINNLRDLNQYIGGTKKMTCKRLISPLLFIGGSRIGIDPVLSPSIS